LNDDFVLEKGLQIKLFSTTLAKIGLFDKTFKVAERIDDPYWKRYALKEIAKRLVEMEEYERVLELLEGVMSLTSHPGILKEIN